MEEEWRDIKYYEGVYQVSNLGGVRSLDRTIIHENGRAFRIKGKLLKPNNIIGGYNVVHLRHEGSRSYQVDRLVAAAFMGWEKGGNTVVCHINERSDDSISNLIILNKRAYTRRNTIGTSKYRGVCWDTKLNKWKSQIQHNSKKIYLGHFENEEEAAIAYETKQIELDGA